MPLSTIKKPSLLSFTGFRDLWVGQIISQFGDTLHMLVFLWLILAITGNPANVGIVGAFEAAPYVVWAAHAGVLVDRHDRRRLLILSDILSAVLVLGFVAILLAQPKPSLWVVCTFAFALGSVNVFAAPARSAAIPRLVPPERLMEANSLNAAAQNTMPLVGNLLSALVIQAIFSLSRKLAYSLTFGFNALTFLVSAIFMARLPPLLPERKETNQSTWEEAKEGVRFVWRHPTLRPLMGGTLALNFFAAPFLPVMVVMTQEKFKGTPSLLAVLETGFFLGMMVGSLLTMRVKIRRVGLSFSLFLALASLMVFPMGFVALPWQFWVLNFFCGVCIPPASLPLNTLIQLETPDGLRGRVNSALGMIAALITPLGMAVSGPLLQKLGVSGTFTFMAIGLLVTPLLPLLSRPYRLATLPGESEASPSIS
jgi:MFS family permease